MFQKKDKEENKENDPWLWVFAGIAVLKEETKHFKKVNRQLLVLARAGIDFLLTQSGGENKGPTKVRKIEIK